MDNPAPGTIVRPMTQDVLITGGGLAGGTLAIDVADGRIVMAGPYQLDWTGALTADGHVRDPMPTAV